MLFFETTNLKYLVLGSSGKVSDPHSKRTEEDTLLGFCSDPYGLLRKVMSYSQTKR